MKIVGDYTLNMMLYAKDLLVDPTGRLRLLQARSS
jgi:hypothetical protein